MATQHCHPRLSSVDWSSEESQAHRSYSTSKAAAIHLSRTLVNTVVQDGFRSRSSSSHRTCSLTEIDTSGSSEDQKSYNPKESFNKVLARPPGNKKDKPCAAMHLVVNQYIMDTTNLST